VHSEDPEDLSSTRAILKIIIAACDRIVWYPISNRSSSYRESRTRENQRLRSSCLILRPLSPPLRQLPSGTADTRICRANFPGSRESHPCQACIRKQRFGGTEANDTGRKILFRGLGIGLILPLGGRSVVRRERDVPFRLLSAPRCALRGKF